MASGLSKWPPDRVCAKPDLQLLKGEGCKDKEKGKRGKRQMAQSNHTDCIWTFSTPLGWFAILGRNDTLKALSFGYPSAGAAVRALDPRLVAHARRRRWNENLVRRLRAYCSGRADDFRDVAVELGPQARFRSRVIRACRQIPCGETRTYGQLAALAGYPGAARAVGQCMAANRIPLVIPCHRVVGGDGRLRGYSGPGGVRTKLRLLEIERCSRSHPFFEIVNGSPGLSSRAWTSGQNCLQA
jgi:methylated-DNA-[protein]-cysteine S-methyltransferase